MKLFEVTSNQYRNKYNSLSSCIPHNPCFRPTNTILLIQVPFISSNNVPIILLFDHKYMSDSRSDFLHKSHRIIKIEFKQFLQGYYDCFYYYLFSYFFYT